eukprot:Ihof_evm1s1029 gene=Ihof_evmTU1s1029
MLEAVQTIHEERIVHNDLKPANFIFVGEALKLIDFGIAKAIQVEHTSVYREGTSIYGTFNYMSPETLTAQRVTMHRPGIDPEKTYVKFGPASDIWSLGCILHAMVFGTTPFQHIVDIHTKISAVLDERVVITIPPHDNPDLCDVIQSCLKRDPKQRPTIDELLSHPFLHPSANRVVQEPPTNKGRTLNDVNQVIQDYLKGQGVHANMANKLTQRIDQFLNKSLMPPPPKP